MYILFQFVFAVICEIKEMLERRFYIKLQLLDEMYCLLELFNRQMAQCIPFLDLLFATYATFLMNISRLRLGLFELVLFFKCL